MAKTPLDPTREDHAGLAGALEFARAGVRFSGLQRSISG